MNNYQRNLVKQRKESSRVCVVDDWPKSCLVKPWLISQSGIVMNETEMKSSDVANRSGKIAHISVVEGNNLALACYVLRKQDDEVILTPSSLFFLFIVRYSVLFFSITWATAWFPITDLLS
ncbi:hypothetical protein Ciccas_003260 [Cichlidogyrus casuarinus]|uniref:Uncharacterized protein n=1 Tax=Cichlidogyrus casuarinus TaxID=1844966 RepID=A0ABD2QEV8_9PLAT